MLYKPGICYMEQYLPYLNKQNGNGPVHDSIDILSKVETINSSNCSKEYNIIFYSSLEVLKKFELGNRQVSNTEHFALYTSVLLICEEQCSSLQQSNDKGHTVLAHLLITPFLNSMAKQNLLYIFLQSGASLSSALKLPKAKEAFIKMLLLEYEIDGTADAAVMRQIFYDSVMQCIGYIGAGAFCQKCLEEDTSSQALNTLGIKTISKADCFFEIEINALRSVFCEFTNQPYANIHALAWVAKFRTHRGDNVLHYIARNELYLDSLRLQYLVERLGKYDNFNLDEANNEGWSPLHYAACNPDYNLLCIFIDAKCNLEVKQFDNRHTTPLCMAIVHKREYNVSILLEANAHVIIDNIKGCIENLNANFQQAK